QKLSGTLLGGKVALRLVQAVRQWAKERNCEHLMVHVTNGVEVQDVDRFFRRCGMKTVGGNYKG
ncbi:MAG: GNAT family N-acetyltransferase, partial [Roseibium sp.]|nr:GNAT family N-acetyltransferase [Roseibium sp.]